MPIEEFKGMTRMQMFAIMDAYRKFNPYGGGKEEQQLSDMEDIHAELNA